MRKAFLLVIVLALALGITYLVLHKSGSEGGKPAERDAPLAISSKTSAFNRSFFGVLDRYFQLADGFFSGDTAAISAASAKLGQAIDSIRFDQFKADTAIIQTAVNLAQSIQGDITGLNGEIKLEQKKREFNMITDELYSLIRTVRYDGSVIYHIRCTAAFSDSSEAYWLSPNNQIVNPYWGKNHPYDKDKMLEYGEVIDSIRFSAPASE